MRSMIMNFGLLVVLLGTFVSAKSTQKSSFFPDVQVTMVSESKKASVQKVAATGMTKNANVLEDLDFIPSSSSKESPHDLVFGQDIFTLDVTESPSESPSAAPTATPTTTAPSVAPTFAPTRAPTTVPTASPTAAPSVEPSPSPTASPSFTPTFAPTVKGAQTATIAMSQSVSGISSSQWNANAAANCAIFALSVESVTGGLVTSSQVGSCTVADARRLRRILVELLTDSINVGYSITVPASTDITSVTTSITTSISTAVSTGTFTTTMNSVALSQTASLNYTSPLTVAASDSVTVQSVSVIGASTEDNTNLTDGQISGIVIGVLVGSFCLAMGCYAIIVNGRSYWSNNAEEERREFAVNIGLSDEENLYASSEGLTILPPSPAPLIEDAAPAPAPTETPLFVSQHDDDEVFYSEPHDEHHDFELEEVVVVREDETTQL